MMNVYEISNHLCSPKCVLPKIFSIYYVFSTQFPPKEKTIYYLWQTQSSEACGEKRVRCCLSC